MFGSSIAPDGTMIRHCHGNEEWLCRFSFSESQDHLYFTKKVKDKKSVGKAVP